MNNTPGLDYIPEININCREVSIYKCVSFESMQLTRATSQLYIHGFSYSQIFLWNVFPNVLQKIY